MKRGLQVVIHAGQVLAGGRKTATFFWPDEWGPLGIPCVAEMTPVADSDATREFARKFVANAVAAQKTPERAPESE